MTDTSQAEVNDSTTVETEGGAEGEAETITISKAEWEKTHSTLGSLKRENKDLKKPKDEPKETVQTKTDNSLLEKAYLRSAGVTSEDEVELALSTAKKWDMPIDKLVDDEDFKIKLEKVRTQKSNELATSKVKGGGSGKPGAKEDAAYWKAKGVPPTPADIPDKSTRVKIIREMMASAKNGGKKFYND